MTTIIMHETEDSVLIAFDSKVSGSSTQSSTNYSQKVFINPAADIILGVAGYLRAAQVLAYADLPAIDEHDWDVDRYVTMELLPAIHEVVNTYGDEDDTDYSRFLAVVRGRVYDIAGGSWTRNPSGVYGIGSGSDYAIGAYAAGADLAEAVEIAAEFDAATNDDVTVWEVTSD